MSEAMAEEDLDINVPEAGGSEQSAASSTSAAASESANTATSETESQSATESQSTSMSETMEEEDIEVDVPHAGGDEEEDVPLGVVEDEDEEEEEIVDADTPLSNGIEGVKSGKTEKSRKWWNIIPVVAGAMGIGFAGKKLHDKKKK